MSSQPKPPTRVIVVALIQNAAGNYLLCKKPEGRGVFPGAWGLPGGGIEPGEQAEDALRREVWEEVGLKIDQIESLFFKDGVYPKYFDDGSQQDIYMIFLIFRCQAASKNVRLNQEFEEFAWVAPEQIGGYQLNPETHRTLVEAEIIPAVGTGF